MPQRKFDASRPEEIERFAKKLEGKTLGDSITDFPTLDQALGTHSKALLGDCLEHYFGIKKNNMSGPDFAAAGVELKTVPLAARKDGLGGHRIKERTKICGIDFHRLVTQSWKTSDARHKLEKVLFIFVLPGKTPRTSRVEKVLLWDLPPDIEKTLAGDWQKVYDKVAAGKADLVSESDGKYLGASTAGAGRGDRTTQPASPTPAKRRAFSLKPPFTRALYLTESLRENLGLGSHTPLEEALLKRLHAHAGRTIGDLAKEFGIPRTHDYQFCARVVRKALGARHGDAQLKELREAGIQVKTLKIGPNGMPFESMSFPAFKYAELLKEDWEHSTLKRRLSHMLLVPMTGGERGLKNDHLRRLGKAFFWNPSPSEWVTIRREWELFISEIRAGKAKALTPASETEIIHVRPHGKDSTDTDVAPGVGAVVKKSFWVNARYLAGLVKP